MKKTLLLLSLIIVLLISACDKLEKFNDLYIRMKVTTKSFTFAFDTTSAPQNFHIITNGNYVNFDSVFYQNSIDTNKIAAITVTSVNFTMDTTGVPAKYANFKFLNDIALYVTDYDATLPYVLIGKLDSVTADVLSVDMPAINEQGVDVKDIVKHNRLRYKLEGYNKKAMKWICKVDVTVKYTIDAALIDK